MAKSTAARVGPRQLGPPAFTPSQRDFIIEVLRLAGDTGITKKQFRDGSHPLLRGRSVAQPDSRICELEKENYIFEHVKESPSVRYILRGEPLEPKPVQSAPRPGWRSQGFRFGSGSIDPKPPNPQQGQTFLNFETGRTR